MKIKRYEIIFLSIFFASVCQAGSDVFERMPPLNMDIVMAVKDRNIGDVLFRHVTHTTTLKCVDCHPSLFIPAKGSNNKKTMAQMDRGYSCGACHGKDTFGLDDCNKCHNASKRR